MGIVKLGTRPKTFVQTITVPLHEGESGEMQVNFVYRTRTEFAQLQDELAELARTKATSASEAELAKGNVERLMALTAESNVDYLMKAMAGWNLDRPFDRAAVAQLCDELPGAAAAIMGRYAKAITEGRLGN